MRKMLIKAQLYESFSISTKEQCLTEPGLSNKFIMLCLLVVSLQFCSITVHTADTFLNNSVPLSLIATYSCLGKNSLCFVLLGFLWEYCCMVPASPRTQRFNFRESNLRLTEAKFIFFPSFPSPFLPTGLATILNISDDYIYFSLVFQQFQCVKLPPSPLLPCLLKGQIN